MLLQQININYMFCFTFKASYKFVTNLLAFYTFIEIFTAVAQYNLHCYKNDCFEMCNNSKDSIWIRADDAYFVGETDSL